MTRTATMAKKNTGGKKAGGIGMDGDSAMAALMAHATKKFGNNACLASDLAKMNWGMPCDHLAYRWVADQTIYPMGRIVGVAGAKESCKSAYAMSLAKQFLDRDGLCIYIDTENKKSPALFAAVVGPDNAPKALDYRAFSTEEWQSQVFDTLEYIESNEVYANKPVIIIVDSLGGVDTEETVTKVEEEGHAAARGTGGMVKAKSHNEFFRAVNKKLNQRPCTLIYVNHLSDDMDSPIKGAKKKPGGTGQDYHAVLDLWFSVVSGTPVYKSSMDYTERMLKVQAKKNSHGASQRSVVIPYRWRNDPETGQICLAWFDWDAALAKLLADDKSEARQKVSDILTVTVNANKYSCQALGLVQVSDSELGEAIRTNVELRERLSDAMGINRTNVFEGLGMSEEEMAVYSTPVVLRNKAATPAKTEGAP